MARIPHVRYSHAGNSAPDHVFKEISLGEFIGVEIRNNLHFQQRSLNNAKWTRKDHFDGDWTRGNGCSFRGTSCVRKCYRFFGNRNEHCHTDCFKHLRCQFNNFEHDTGFIEQDHDGGRK